MRRSDKISTAELSDEAKDLILSLSRMFMAQGTLLMPSGERTVRIYDAALTAGFDEERSAAIAKHFNAQTESIVALFEENPKRAKRFIADFEAYIQPPVLAS